jgi:hypothetical protein
VRELVRERFAGVRELRRFVPALALEEREQLEPACSIWCVCEPKDGSTIAFRAFEESSFSNSR